MTEDKKAALMKTIDINNWKIVSTDPGYCILEVTGGKEEIEKALAVLKPLGMDDFTRTGTVALAKQNNNLRG